ncbi:muconate/chloromuconate family cycloisomerase [Bacillaceae bacterium W0354]
MTQIKISQITTEIVDVPIKRPHQFSTEKVSKKSFLIVRLHLNNGIIGIGEGTTPGIWWNGESVETMKVVIDQYIAELIKNQDPRFVEKLLQLMDRHIRSNPFAKSAVEMAIYDALGKYYQVPVHQLLGGLYSNKIEVRWALASGTVEGDINEGKMLVESNQYKSFKIKSGKEEPNDDASRSIKIAQGLKGHATIGIDPNGSWTRLTAKKWMHEFREANIDFLEQPLPPHDVEGMAILTEMKQVPIMADESVGSIYEATTLAREKAADIFSLKIQKHGGLRNTIKIAAIAESSGIACFGGTSLESSIGTAASLHAFSAIRNLNYGTESFGPNWLADDLVKHPLEIQEGFITVPEDPGLGIELDEEKVKKYKRHGS